MAVSETIQEILQGIDEAQYGRDMRQYIHKGIQKCYEEGSAGETDLVARNDISAVMDSIADVEHTSTASRAYSVNEYLYYNGVLYRVTSAITSGGTLAVGTNITQASFANEVTSMFSYESKSAVRNKSITGNANVYYLTNSSVSLKKGLNIIDVAFSINETANNVAYTVVLSTSSSESTSGEGSTDVLFFFGDGREMDFRVSVFIKATAQETRYLKVRAGTAGAFICNSKLNRLNIGVL